MVDKFAEATAAARITRSSAKGDPLRLSSVLVVGCALLLGAVGCGKTPVAKPPTRPDLGLLPSGAKTPNVVLVLVDTLRADRLAAYGSTAGLAPNVDSLAAAGIVFDRCQAPAPWTLPSMGSVFTAQHPSVHGATSYTSVRDMNQGRRTLVPVLADSFTLMAEVLRDHGYRCFAASANPFVQAKFGFGQGFETFDGGEIKLNGTVGTWVNKAAADWLEKYDGGKPFLMYLHYMDVHGPYDAPASIQEPLLEAVDKLPRKRALTEREWRLLIPYLKAPPPGLKDPSLHDRLKGYLEYWPARYNAGVTEFDGYFKAVCDLLKSRGLWENTLLVLTADHGEAFLEHGMWDHGYTLYQEELHVPLVMHWPATIPAGARVGGTTRLIDLYPTILEQLRLPIPAGLEGRPMVDLMGGATRAAPTPAFSGACKGEGRNPPRLAVVEGDWKLIKTFHLTKAGGQTRIRRIDTELFDLSRDPGEKSNLAAAQKSKADALWALMLAQIETDLKRLSGAPVQYRSEEEKLLRGLGYAGGGEEADENGDERDGAQRDGATSAPTPSRPASAPNP